MVIEVREARYFLAVARTLHFERAAETLDMSQPPLSQAILQLERRLGARLLDRTNRKVALTETGRVFEVACRDLVAVAQHAQEVATQAEAGLVGTLCVGVVTSALGEPLSTTIEAFRRSRPQAELRVTEVDSRVAAEHLLRRDIDVAVVRLSTPVRGLRIQQWRRDHFVIALPGGHPVEPARLIRTTVRTTMEELHATLGILRQREPVGTQPVEHIGTWSDAAQLVRQAQAGCLQVELTWTGADTMGIALPIRQAVHRIIREGLTNVCRHAPTAGAGVVVEHGAGRVRVGAFDEGQSGTGTPGSGLGLVGVQERVRLLGGSFQAGPVPGHGFRVTAELPLSIAPPAPAEPDSDTDVKADDRWARAGMSAVLATGLIGAVAILVVTFNTVTFDLPDVPVSFDSVHLGGTRARSRPSGRDCRPRRRHAARRLIHWRCWERLASGPNSSTGDQKEPRSPARAYAKGTLPCGQKRSAFSLVCVDIRMLRLKGLAVSRDHSDSVQASLGP